MNDELEPDIQKALDDRDRVMPKVRQMIEDKDKKYLPDFDESWIANWVFEMVYDGGFTDDDIVEAVEDSIAFEETP